MRTWPAGGSTPAFRVLRCLAPLHPRMSSAFHALFIFCCRARPKRDPKVSHSATGEIGDKPSFAGHLVRGGYAALPLPMGETPGTSLMLRNLACLLLPKRNILVCSIRNERSARRGSQSRYDSKELRVAAQAPGDARRRV